MDVLNISAELAVNAYPGRGIAVGLTPDGKHAVITYFIMGRSENSRNRIFEKKGNKLITKPADISKVTDPSLIIYTPVRIFKNTHIVTNGDQTDTIYYGMKQGKSFAKCLRKRTFEPDEPNFTPRISSIVRVKNGQLTYKMSILKRTIQTEDSLQRTFYEYAQPIKGVAHFIHTYKCDGNPIPSFVGEPTPVGTQNDIKEYANTVYNSLNEDNKISLFVRYINLETKQFEDVVINKYKEVK